jgi:hypothetical protein
MTEFERITRDAQSRRAFLCRMSAAGLGAAAVALLAAPGAAHAVSGKTKAKRKGGVKRGVEGSAQAAFPGIPGGSNNEIVLNFALVLERLEADLYRQALNKATGRPLSAPLEANQRNYRLAVPDGLRCQAEVDAGFAYLRQFAYVEAAHRDFLIAAIRAGGGTPVGANPGGYKFPAALPNTLKGILQQIIPLEEVGVRAYLGAAGFLTDLPTIQVAGTIYSTEARHSAAIHLVLNEPIGPTRLAGDKEVVAGPPSEQTFEKFLEPATVIQAASSTYFN